MDKPKQYDFEIRLFSLESEDVTDSKDLRLYQKIKEKFEDSLYCRFNKGVGHLIMRFRGQDFPQLFGKPALITQKEEEPKQENKEESNQEPKAETDTKNGSNVSSQIGEIILKLWCFFD